MKKLIILFIFGSLFAMKTSVAILDLEGINIREDIAISLTQRLISEVINTDEYSVVERRLIEKVLEEMKFQGSGLVDDSTISQIGNLTGAKFIITGSISNYGDKIYSVDSRIIDVETGKSVRSAKYDSEDLLNLLDHGMSIIAHELSGIQKFYGQNKKDGRKSNKQLIPTYTHFSKNNKDHKCTTKLNEPGWENRGIVFYAFLEKNEDNVPIYIHFSKNNKDHKCTAKLHEPGWENRGIVFYAFPESNKSTILE